VIVITQIVSFPKVHIQAGLEASPARGGGWAGARETQTTAPHRASSVGIGAQGVGECLRRQQSGTGTGYCEMLNDRLQFSWCSMCP
jgi:hypothetical protein